MQVAGKLVKSFAWDFSGRLGNQAVSFVIGIILARILSPKEYGLIGMAMVFISISGIFTSFGLGSALVQRKAPDENHYSSSFYFNIIVAIFLSVFFVLTAPLIARFFREPQLINIIRILSLNLILSGFTIVQNAILTRELRFYVLAKARIITTVTSGLIGITLAYSGFGVWSLVVQTLSGSLIMSIYIWYANSWRPILKFKIQALRDLWSFGFHMFLNNVVNTLYDSTSTLIIAKVFSPVDLGLYSRANSLNRFVIKYSSESISSVIYPSMAQLQDNKAELIRMGAKGQVLTSFVTFGLLGILFLTADPLINLLLGKKWIGAIQLYKILCLSGFAIPLSAVTTNMFKAFGSSKEFLIEDLIKKGVGFLSMGIGFLYGIEGFLYSLILTGVFSVLLDMYYVEKILNYKLYEQIRAIWIYPIIAIVEVLIIGFFLRSINSQVLNLVLSSITFLFLYILINRALETSGYKLFSSQLISFLRFNRYKN